MKGISNFIALLIIGCSVVLGQSKKDIEDFKDEFPKTEGNAVSHINYYIGGMKSTPLSKTIPFVKGTLREKYHYIENCDYSYTTNDYSDLSLSGRIYPFCIGRSSRYQSERHQKLYDNVLSDVPNSVKDDATHYLPKGTKINVWFIIVDCDDEKMKSLKLRTHPGMNYEEYPIRFRKLLKKCFYNESQNVEKIVKRVLSKNDGIVFVMVYIPSENGEKKMTGWVRLNDLIKQNIL